MDINLGSSSHEHPSPVQPGNPEGWQTHHDEQDIQNTTHSSGQLQTPQDESYRQDIIQPLGIQSPVPVIYTDGSVMAASPQIVYVHDQIAHNVSHAQYNPRDSPVPVLNPSFGNQPQSTPIASYTMPLPNTSSSSSAQMLATDPRLSSYRLMLDPNHERAINASQQSPLLGSRFSMGTGSPAMDSRTTVSMRDSQKEVVEENFMEVMPNHLIYDPNQHYQFQPQFEPIQENDPKTVATKRNRRICGLSLCLFLTVLLYSLALFGTGIGIGFAIGHKKNRTIQSVSGSNQTQALFGSGLATTQQEGNDGPLELFYQNSDGKVWFMESAGTGAWPASSQYEVPTSAKLPTPLSVVVFPNQWHLFYININDVVWQSISNDNGKSWHDGPLAGSISVLKDPNVSLRACYATKMNATTDGIILWAATSETNVVEYSWLYGSDSWSHTSNFTANGHAGIGCYSWNGTNWYTMNVDQNNNVKIWWKDTASANSQWAATAVSIPGVMANSSVVYSDNNLFVQMANGSLVGYNISFTGATTSETGSFTLPQKPIPGSQLSVAVFPQLSIYSQTTEHNITETVQGPKGWTSSDLTLMAP